VQHTPRAPKRPRATPSRRRRTAALGLLPLVPLALTACAAAPPADADWTFDPAPAPLGETATAHFGSRSDPALDPAAELTALAADLNAHARVEIAEAAAAWPEPEVSKHILQRLLHIQQIQLRVAMDNLANINTTGFKRSVVHIETLPPETHVFPGGTLARPGAAPPIGAQLGSGATNGGASPIFSSGTLEMTDRNLDLAIDGKGFLTALRPDGSTVFTRDGHLRVNRDGALVTSAGHTILPQVTVPDDLIEIAFAPDGRVTGRTAGSPDTTTGVGQILLSSFQDPWGLRAIGGNLWAASDASGSPLQGPPGRDGMGTLRQGFLERSNVIAIDEIATLRDALRSCRAIRQALGGAQ